MNFKESKEYREMISLLNVENVIDSKVVFQVYLDNIFTFHIKDTEKIHEFNVICEEMLFREMLLTELLDARELKYIEYGIYENNKIQSDIFWNINFQNKSDADN
jgi:hypothetical protein